MSFNLSGGIRPLFIILVDISGYTRFIRFHKVSLLHAEKIIAELMESILKEVEVPVMAHEILGDAISFYALDEGKPGQADAIYAQIQKYFNAFREREASLISACKLCKCDACRQVGRLKLKAILHHGTAAFTQIQNIQKISGEDVILSHRLLKNSLPMKEYILMTEAFSALCRHLKKESLIQHQEYDEDIGTTRLLVEPFEEDAWKSVNVKLSSKFNDFVKLEWTIVYTLFRKPGNKFVNLPLSEEITAAVPN